MVCVRCELFLKEKCVSEKLVITHTHIQAVREDMMQVVSSCKQPVFSEP